MQEEVNDKTAQVAVKVTKLTGRALQAALKKLLVVWKNHQDPQKVHKGKQSVK